LRLPALGNRQEQFIPPQGVADDELRNHDSLTWRALYLAPAFAIEAATQFLDKFG